MQPTESECLEFGFLCTCLTAVVNFLSLLKETSVVHTFPT